MRRVSMRTYPKGDPWKNIFVSSVRNIDKQMHNLTDLEIAKQGRKPRTALQASGSFSASLALVTTHYIMN